MLYYLLLGNEFSRSAVSQGSFQVLCVTLDCTYQVCALYARFSFYPGGARLHILVLDISPKPTTPLFYQESSLSRTRFFSSRNQWISKLIFFWLFRENSERQKYCCTQHHKNTHPHRTPINWRQSEKQNHGDTLIFQGIF